MQRSALVRDALAQVEKLRNAAFRGTDDLVVRLLASYPAGGSLPDLLWADLPKEASVQDVADLLSLWSWRTDDNGASIMRAVERWIEECANAKQIEVGLNLDAYPYVDHQLRIDRLQLVATKFPELAGRCRAIIDQSRGWISRDAHSKPSA